MNQVYTKIRLEILQPTNKPFLSPNSGILEQFKFYFLSPIYFICQKTIPDWQDERFHDLYLLTFFVSLIWISFYSYIMIWMITIIGKSKLIWIIFETLSSSWSFSKAAKFKLKYYKLPFSLIEGTGVLNYSKLYPLWTTRRIIAFELYKMNEKIPRQYFIYFKRSFSVCL